MVPTCLSTRARCRYGLAGAGIHDEVSIHEGDDTVAAAAVAAVVDSSCREDELVGLLVDSVRTVVDDHGEDIT